MINMINNHQASKIKLLLHKWNFNLIVSIILTILIIKEMN